MYLPMFFTSTFWLVSGFELVEIICRSPFKRDPLVTIRAVLELCYHRQLSKDLVDKIFSEEYLGRVDTHIRAKPLVIQPRAFLLPVTIFLSFRLRPHVEINENTVNLHKSIGHLIIHLQSIAGCIYVMI